MSSFNTELSNRLLLKIIEIECQMADGTMDWGIGRHVIETLEKKRGTYTRKGSHVTVGSRRPLSEDFRPSHVRRPEYFVTRKVVSAPSSMQKKIDPEKWPNNGVRQMADDVGLSQAILYEIPVADIADRELSDWWWMAHLALSNIERILYDKVSR